MPSIPAGGESTQPVPDAVARHYVAWLTSSLREAEHGDHGGDGVARQITLRPYGNPLPLGFFSFAVGMVLMAGTGLGWLSTVADVRTAGILMAAFVFPLELIATVFALLTRDTPTAAALGLYSTLWLALGLVTTLDPATQVSRPVGLLLGAFALMLVPLAVLAAFGKVLICLVLGVSAVRSGFAAAYQLGAPHWTDRVSGIGALVLLALACCAGTTLLVEDLRGSAGLVGRRKQAAAAMRAEQPGEHPAEPGVRPQL
jgi:succinate-acetate transporter protein